MVEKFDGGNNHFKDEIRRLDRKTSGRSQIVLDPETEGDRIELIARFIRLNPHIYDDTVIFENVRDDEFNKVIVFDGPHELENTFPPPYADLLPVLAKKRKNVVNGPRAKKSGPRQINHGTYSNHSHATPKKVTEYNNEPKRRIKTDRHSWRKSLEE